MVVALAATALGGLLTAVAIQIFQAHRRCADGVAWLVVANVNTLLRADLEHLWGDDRNDGLRELRTALADAARRRPPAQRSLLERFNGLIGVAIAFGEKMHDESGNVNMRAVAHRRAHVLTALALGERIEAAFGGIAELARDAERGDMPTVPGAGHAQPRRRRPVVAVLPADHRFREPRRDLIACGVGRRKSAGGAVARRRRDGVRA